MQCSSGFEDCRHRSGEHVKCAGRQTEESTEYTQTRYSHAVRHLRRTQVPDLTQDGACECDALPFATAPLRAVFEPLAQQVMVARRELANMSSAPTAWAATRMAAASGFAAISPNATSQRLKVRLAVLGRVAKDTDREF